MIRAVRIGCCIYTPHPSLPTALLTAPLLPLPTLSQLEAGNITLVVPGHSYQAAQDIFKIIRKEVELSTQFPSALLQQHQHQQLLLPTTATTAAATEAAACASNNNNTTNTNSSTSSTAAGKVVSISATTLTAKDIERDRGRQLSKYERNIMIFNWLQTLEETTYDMMS